MVVDLKPSRSRVMEEIKMLWRINSRHVLQLFDSWEHTDESGRKTMVLATELMTGGTLKQYGKCPSIVIRNCGRQILKGLDALHTNKPRPIIHRDLKCSNIFIDKASGTVKIGDLGLATLKSSTSRTKSNKGTPMCKAPEVSTNGHYNEKVDNYSFGMCLLELSTGEYPYKEYTNEGQLIFAIVSYRKLPKVLESVEDSTLKGVITGCIKFDPNERYTVKELLSHEFFLSNQEVIIQERHPDGKTASMKIQNGSDEIVVPYPYDFKHHTPQTVTQDLISSGKLCEADRNAVIDALTEKIAVLSLLSKTSNGIGEVKTDSGDVKMDTICSTDVSDKTTTEEENMDCQIQLDDGAKEPDTIDTRHSMEATNKTEEGLGPIHFDYGAWINQQPPPPLQSLTPNVVEHDPNESVMFHSVKLSTLRVENSLVTLKTPENTSTSKEYDCWRKNIPYVLKLLGESSFPSASGLLYEESLISHELYDDIVTSRPGLSERQQIILLFNIIDRKLQDTDREIVETTWKAFTSAVVKTDSRYKKIKANLESLVNEQLKSELEAFRSNKERLCRLLQASVLRLANQLWSDSVLTSDERRQVIDETFHYHQKWMRNMQDEISERIEKDPTVFYKVVETLERVDGLLKEATRKYLTLQRET